MAARSWREIRGERPLNEGRVATYKRLMEAEALLDDRRRRLGVSEDAIGEALEAALAGAEGDDQLYLATLARYVEMLGGRLEVQAVFPDETIALPSAQGTAS
jgi:hypothetical protein